MENTDYKLLDSQLESLTAGEPDALANSANFVALLFNAMPKTNWVGIYVLRGEELVLGPFQGQPACVRIAVGQGVCGTAVEQEATLRVKDVYEFSGHIACDPESMSEIVIPLYVGKQLCGVLDIDSPIVDRFSEDDQTALENLCGRFSAIISTDNGGFI